MADLTDLLTVPDVKAFLKSRAEWDALKTAKAMPQFSDPLEILRNYPLFLKHVAFIEQERQRNYDGYLAQLRGENAQPEKYTNPDESC
ncbi:hypothetical protein HYS49_02810 [Candidatus Woesearchaeota archaeon]|nr:hypothetical protein [Candidatus Woesearchaeota archaeon]